MTAPAADLTLLAADEHPGDWDVAATVVTDRPGRGAVAVRVRPGLARRLEPTASGPALLQARSDGRRIRCEVWGTPDLTADEVEHLLAAARGWAGCDDRLDGYDQVAARHPVVAEISRRLGPVRLSTMPRVCEALGRSVLGQLVQSVEARRSTVQVAALAGHAGPAGLWTWPEAARIGATDAWALRRCGVSLRSAKALHAAAVDDRRLEAVRGSWERLDARLRALPGVGAWTSAETRLALGDPDAVSVGDYHIPAIVGTALTGWHRPRQEWTDDELVELLAPFEGHRGRVQQLLVRAAAMRMVPRPERRAPRAALSAHRYW